MTIVHLSLTPALEAYIKAKVETEGEYLNANELVRAAILQMIRSDYQYLQGPRMSAVGTGALTGGESND